MRKVISCVLICSIFLAGCAGREANPIPVYMPGDEKRSCSALQTEVAQLQADMQRLLPKTDKGFTNALWAAAGVFVIVPFFFMDLKDAEKIEYEAMRQRHNRLLVYAAENGCDFGEVKAERIPSAAEKITIVKVANFKKAITEHVNQNRASVVTVFAGDSHGSGFFISENGYLFTSAHVVGGVRMVTIKLVTGRELIGEVIRKDDRRDIAVVKTEESGMIPLPVRITPVKVGDEVYALGSPLKEDYSATLSKGIVSGFRVEDGKRFIQSDVNVLPGSSGGPLVDDNGNVVGIAARGYMWQGPTGLNFFIPIYEALNSLEIELIE